MPTAKTPMGLPSAAELANLYVLDSMKGFGPQKFKVLYQAHIPAADVIRNPNLLPVPGKLGDPIRSQLKKVSSKLIDECAKRAEKQLKVAETTKSQILTFSHPLYPPNVFNSNNPIGILYVRGNVTVLRSQKTVACVGSRNIREPYSRLHESFARTASEQDVTVVSGFALGADTIGHKAAIENSGHTICVMPSGLDRPFPPENKDLWHTFLLNDRAVFVSEFPFGTGAASLNLRKRNKLIVAFAQGVLVSQSAATGGAMNAYRFALEQKKPISTFLDDGTEDTSGNKVIAANLKSRGVTFPSSDPDELAYQQWLRTLSSST